MLRPTQIPAELFVPPPPDHPGQAVAYASDIHRGGGLPPHHHERAQLLTIVSGSIAVTTREGTFVVPAERALWIPARTIHETRHLSSTRVHTLYIATDAAPALPGRTTVLQVNPLLRAIVDALMSKSRDSQADGSTSRLVAVLLDQITSSRILPLHLPMPRDGALRRIAECIVEEPTDVRTIAAWSSLVKVSVRTLERRFKSETGLSLRSYRRQAKLFKALELLSTGISVSEISDRLGFEEPSPFIAMFRAAFGVSPARYRKEVKTGAF